MWRLDKHKLSKIGLVCCLLHNILVELEDHLNEALWTPESKDVVDLGQQIKSYSNKVAST